MKCGRMTWMSGSLQFSIGVMMGIVVWYASPTGGNHIGDAPNDYYDKWTLISGMVSTLGWMNGWYWGPAGVYFGQAVYSSFIDFRSPFFILLIGGPMLLIGGVVGVFVGNLSVGIAKAIIDEWYG